MYHNNVLILKFITNKLVRELFTVDLSIINTGIKLYKYLEDLTPIKKNFMIIIYHNGCILKDNDLLDSITKTIVCYLIPNKLNDNSPNTNFIMNLLGLGFTFDIHSIDISPINSLSTHSTPIELNLGVDSNDDDLESPPLELESGIITPLDFQSGIINALPHVLSTINSQTIYPEQYSDMYNMGFTNIAYLNEALIISAGVIDHAINLYMLLDI